MKIFLHIGLHKTGTKFLQHKVFKFINKKDFEYNPILLTQLICDLIKADIKDENYVLDEINNQLKILNKKGTKKILISREIMSGDLLKFYSNSKFIHKKLKKALPNSIIIITLRYQYDWLISCYRESVNIHHYQSFYQFLFGKKSENDFIKNDIKNLNFYEYLKSLFNLFGKENVKILFYEEFKSNKYNFINKIEKILNIDKLYIANKSEIPNRGYSALSIYLSIARYNFFQFIGLKKLIHRPIYFFGKNSIPAGFEDISILPKKKYWGDHFLRDNEEVRNSNYLSNLNKTEKFNIFFSWRNFLKNFIDKYFYLDWDFVDKSLQKDLNVKFIKNNLKLEKDFKIKLPENYKKLKS